jgi:hypothetical protein
MAEMSDSNFTSVATISSTKNCLQVADDNSRAIHDVIFTSTATIFSTANCLQVARNFSSAQTSTKILLAPQQFLVPENPYRWHRSAHPKPSTKNYVQVADDKSRAISCHLQAICGTKNCCHASKNDVTHWAKFIIYR